MQPTTQQQQNHLPLKKVFVHHVFFYLKDKNKSELESKLISGLLTLELIPQIKFFNIGKPTDSNREVVVKDYDISLLLFFDGIEDEENYQNHEIHKKFVAEYQHLWQKVVVYDTLSISI